MLQLKNISLFMLSDDRALISGFDFSLKDGDRIALIGEEGNGKSTLLAFMCNYGLVSDYVRYEGEIVRKGKFGYMPQFVSAQADELTVAEFFDGSDIYSAYEHVNGMGLSYDFLLSDRKLKTLSGGEKVKVRLLKVLCDEPDALFLDEPSNDLDLATLGFLREFICGCDMPVVFISHDEELISSAANGIIHIEQLHGKVESRATVARVSYEEYKESRNLLFDRQTAIARKQRDDYDKQMKKLQKLYERARNNGSWKNADGTPSSDGHARQAMQSVIARGKRMEREKEDFLDIPVREESIITRFDESVFLPPRKRVLDLFLPRLEIGGKTLSQNVSLSVFGADKVCIVGKNGAGKSTLLKEIWRTLRDRNDISVGYMPQNYEDVLDTSATPTEFLRARYSRDQLTQAMTFLGNMRFTYAEMNRRIENLSGGQKAKLLFLDMVLKKRNVLVLDEPTRNFSPLSAPVVRSALREFGGAVISVSHDSGYINEVADKVYELTPDGLVIV